MLSPGKCHQRVRGGDAAQHPRDLRRRCGDDIADLVATWGLGYPRSVAESPTGRIPTRKSRPMANIKSQIKRNRQNERANARNRAVRSEVRTHFDALVLSDRA